MLETGALDGAAGIAGIHVWPDVPSGTITTKARATPSATSWQTTCQNRYGKHAQHFEATRGGSSIDGPFASCDTLAAQL